MTKAAELAKMGEVLTNSQIGGRRNIIINGAMQVAQRGTSFSSITSSTYTLDRFAVRNATAVSQSTDVPSGEGFESSLFYDSDGTRSSSNIRQPMEDVTRLLNDTAVTLSFWLKSSAATTISVDLCDANATNVDVTTSWAKYTVTFPATSNLNSGDTYEAGAGWVDFNLGSDYPDVYLTGVQLEVGEQATPFEHRSFGEELALCQRYFEKSFNAVTTPGTTGQAGVISIRQYSTNAVPSIFYKQAKRASATMTIYSAATGASGKARDNDGAADITIAILNNGETHCTVVLNGTDANYLHFHYTADAEL